MKRQEQCRVLFFFNFIAKFKGRKGEAVPIFKKRYLMNWNYAGKTDMVGVVLVFKLRRLKIKYVVEVSLDFKDSLGRDCL